jgi:hypothetical protein
MLERAGSVLRERRALPLSEAQARDAHGYDWVRGHGRLLPSPVLLLDNQRRGSAVGVRVLAVLRPRDAQAQLVDLGWLPLPGDRRMPECACRRRKSRSPGCWRRRPAPAGAGSRLRPVEPVGRERAGC